MAKTRKTSADSIPSPAEEFSVDPGYRDRVAMRAYELYLARGAGDGGDFDDWLAAERELATSNGESGRGDAGE